jgi:hypothetical protein
MVITALKNQQLAHTIFKSIFEAIQFNVTMPCLQSNKP